MPTHSCLSFLVQEKSLIVSVAVLGLLHTGQSFFQNDRISISEGKMTPKTTRERSSPAGPSAEFSQGQMQTSDELAFLRKVQQAPLIYRQVVKASGIPKVRKERDPGPGLLFSPVPPCSLVKAWRTLLIKQPQASQGYAEVPMVLIPMQPVILRV